MQKKSQFHGKGAISTEVGQNNSYEITSQYSILGVQLTALHKPTKYRTATGQDLVRIVNRFATK